MKNSLLALFTLIAYYGFGQSTSFSLDDLQREPSADYSIQWRPDLWYNGFDGIKLGLKLNSQSISEKHEFNLAAWYATGMLQNNTPEVLEGEQQKVQLTAQYSTLFGKWKQEVFIQSANGLLKYKLSASTFIFDNLRLNFGVQTWNRKTSSSLNYTWFANSYEQDAWNSSLFACVTKQIDDDKYENQTTLAARYGFLNGFTSQNDYFFIEVENRFQTTLTKKKSELRIRAYGRYGSAETPVESQLYLAGANPEQLESNPYTQARIGEQASFGNTQNHGFAIEGGLFLRGFANYTAPIELNSNYASSGYRGNSGWAVNAEIDFNKWISTTDFKSDFLRLRSYFFADIGQLSYTDEFLDLSGISPLRADVGIGMRLDVKKWGKYSGLKQSYFRLDIPFWVNEVPSQNSHFEFRTAFGFGILL